MKDALASFINRKIVIDTRSSIVYIGTLQEVMESCIVLAEVDVFDVAETHTSKERYIMNSKTSGVKANRDSVYVNMEWILSFSPLEDIKEFSEF